MRGEFWGLERTRCLYIEKYICPQQMPFGEYEKGKRNGGKSNKKKRKSTENT
jgi:hypothetical protein